MAGPEVVDGQPDPLQAQSCQAVQRRPRVFHQPALRDLQHQARWRQADMRQHARNGVRKVERNEVVHRHVDGDLQVETHVRPPPHLRQRLREHLVRQGIDQAVFFGSRDESIWKDQTPLGMLPTDQRLHSHELTRFEGNLRLIVIDQLAPGDRVRQLAATGRRVGPGQAHRPARLDFAKHTAKTLAGDRFR
jgi:hypothetical protein